MEVSVEVHKITELLNVLYTIPFFLLQVEVSMMSDCFSIGVWAFTQNVNFFSLQQS